MVEIFRDNTETKTGNIVKPLHKSTVCSSSPTTTNRNSRTGKAHRIVTNIFTEGELNFTWTCQSARAALAAWNGISSRLQSDDWHGESKIVQCSFQSKKQGSSNGIMNCQVESKGGWFFMHTISLWNSLLQDIMDAPNLQAVEGQLDKILEETHWALLRE